MQHALILTKNRVTEEEIVGKLQRLNYETLCSFDLLYHIQKYASSPFFSYFRWIVLSETLCNEEVELILEQLKGYPVFLVRVVEKSMDEEEIAYWEGQGLAGTLLKNASFEEIREKISEIQKIMLKKQQKLNQNGLYKQTDKDGLKIFISRLSKTERKLFDSLLSVYSKGITLSRVDLCEQLWADGATPSNMSQLSCLINKLKHKLEECGFTGETIITMWGRGYKLSSNFSELWIQHS